MLKESTVVAKRYAEALFNLALREKNLEAVEKSFDTFVNNVTKNRKFVDFMESPVIPHKSKEEVLARMIPQDMPQLLGFFLKVILSKKRFEILTLIEANFQQRSEKHRGIRKAELVSAAKIEPATEKRLTAILEKKLNAQIRLVSKTDPKLIGGFILKMDESVIDTSYQTKLREMKQRLYSAAV